MLDVPLNSIVRPYVFVPQRATVRERAVRFLSPSGDGAVNEPVHEAAANTLTVASGGRMSLASTFVLLGVKPAPKMTTTTTTDAAGTTAKERLSARSHHRSGVKRGISSLSYASDVRQDERKAIPKQHLGSRDVVSWASSKHSASGRPREGEGVSKRSSSNDEGSGGAKKAAEQAAKQAAKMSARRNRHVAAMLSNQTTVNVTKS